MRAVLDQPTVKTAAKEQSLGLAYCPICTHTVDAAVVTEPRRAPKVVAGQRCRRCSASLDAGYVVRAGSSN
jgi:hypothetical protein